MRRPGWLDDYAAVDAEALELPADLPGLVHDLLSSPNVASKRWVWEQYDQLVGFGTVAGPGGDAGVVRLPDSSRGVACATDGNGRWCELDPREGTRRVAAEAARNVACAGARPLAATNCLNFGNPERPEIMWQFAEAVAGLGEACRELSTPITGGNVSFYNETRGRAIHPSPVVGILGVLEDVAHAVGTGFQEDGDVVLQVGAPTRPGLAGSELQRLIGSPALGGTLEPIDLAAEARLIGLLADAATAGLLRSAHDVSGGGLVVALAESCLAGDVGVDYLPEEAPDTSQLLFSESPTRVIVSVPADDVDAFVARCEDADVWVREAGRVGGASLKIGDVVDLPLDGVRGAYESGLPTALDVDHLA